MVCASSSITGIIDQLTRIFVTSDSVLVKRVTTPLAYMRRGYSPNIYVKATLIHHMLQAPMDSQLQQSAFPFIGEEFHWDDAGNFAGSSSYKAIILSSPRKTCTISRNVKTQSSDDQNLKVFVLDYLHYLFYSLDDFRVHQVSCLPK